jgi:hypothetical protein
MEVIQMRYDWKKGDKLLVVDATDGTPLFDGEIVIAGNDIYTNDPNHAIVEVILSNGTSREGFYPYRFKKIGESKIKEKQIDLHLVLVDSCKNFVGIKNNYKEAEELAKSKSDAVTIYKMVEVAKVTSERVVKKVIPQNKKKR